MEDTTTTPSSDNNRRKAHGPTVHAIKRAKFEAKQECRRQQTAALSLSQQTSCLPTQPSWFTSREEYATYITKDDVRIIRRLRAGSDASDIKEDEKARLLRIANWIEPFFELKEIPNNKDKNRLFIGEGTETVRMMIQRCDDTKIEAETKKISATEQPPPVRLLSILSKPATFFNAPIHILGDIEGRYKINKSTKANQQAVPPFKIVIANEEALSEICGFRIARGAMACGVIPMYMQTDGYAWLNRLLSNDQTTAIKNSIQQTKQIRRILAIDAISNAANMGSIFRSAAAFSIDVIILSDDSCDAWYRQSVRTSMGHVISVPILRVEDWERGMLDKKDNDDKNANKCNGLARVLKWLQSRSVECYAAVVDDDKDDNFPPLVTLETHNNDSFGLWCCVLGNEGHGIRKEVIQQCDKRINIGMSKGVDSLSLPIAAGILMHSLSTEPKKDIPEVS